jgi:hypothetical protein
MAALNPFLSANDPKGRMPQNSTLGDKKGVKERAKEEV